MKLIKPTVEIWKPKSYSLEDGFRHAERCGRICYLSNDKITDDSYKKFIGNIIKSKHTSVMEHMTLYLTIPVGSPLYDKYYLGKIDIVRFFKSNKYSIVKESKQYETVDSSPDSFKDFICHCGPTIVYYITTNYRVILDNNIKLKWTKKELGEIIKPYIQNQPTEHEKRVTVHWTISRGIADEFMRHRTLCPSCQSTRYCNFSKDKFGEELSFILPRFIFNLEDPNGNYSIYYDDTYIKINMVHNEKNLKILKWINHLEDVESLYNEMAEVEYKPQEIRTILPLDLKTELVQTGFISDWKNFFELRTGEGAHPDAKYIANKLKQLM